MKIFINLMEEWNVDQRSIQNACRIFKNINLLMTSEILGKNGEEKDKKGKTVLLLVVRPLSLNALCVITDRPTC